MAFPDTDLDVTILAYLGADPNDAPGTWPTPVDLSSRLLKAPMRITRGRRQGQSVSAAGSCTFQLDNTDGALTPLHPSSQYYPDWDLGVPVSVDVDGVGASPPYGRYRGYVAEIKPQIVPGVGANWSTVTVTLGGILRRLSQGSVEQSAMRRAHLLGPLSTDLQYYWPLENATSGDLPSDPTLPGLGNPGTLLGVPVNGNDALTATAALPQFLLFGFGSAQWSSEAPPGASSSVALESARLALRAFVPGSAVLPLTGTIRFGCAFRFRDDLPDSPLSAGEFEATILRVVANSDPDEHDSGWAVRLITSSTGTVRNIDTFSLDASGVATHHSTTATSFALSTWHYVTLDLSSSGGGADTAYSTAIDGQVIHSGTAAGVSWGTVSSQFQTWSIGRDVPGIANVCHAGIWAGSSLPTIAEHYEAMKGYAGEEAHDRFTRVCAEDGIPAVTTATRGTPLGPQPYGGVATILQDAEATDMGILSELLDDWGFGYRARSERYNLTAAMTIDLATYRVTEGEAGDVLTPIRNDARLRNELKISRPGGNEITVSDADSVARHGKYDDSTEVNLETDTGLADQANWRLRLSTHEGLRYTTVPIDLAANNGGADGSDDLLGDWLTIAFGDRIDRTNHPPEHPPETVTLELEGYTETIEARRWLASPILEPFGPWDIGTYQDTPLGALTKRYDTLHSTLTSDVDAGTDTAISVTIATGGSLWTTKSASWVGLQVEAGGAIWNVTSITGSSSPQTINVTATAANGVVKTVPAGTQIRVAPRQRAVRGL